MSKIIFELQNNIKNLREQLNDRIHLAYLNHQSYLCLKSSSNIPLQEISSNTHADAQDTSQVTKISNKNIAKSKKTLQTEDTTNLDNIIQAKLKNLSQIFQKRSENHLNYLIIRQIQSEQECVRRDRLAEYQQKIYDQRRLISDKEVFTQSLLRPKKQRPQNMSSEQFADIRATEKADEQKSKIAALEQEVKNIQNFRKKICESQMKSEKQCTIQLLKKSRQLYNKIKSEDLQKTKAYSLDTVNTSNMNNVCQRPQKPFEQQDLNSEIPTSQNNGNSQTQQDSHNKIQSDGSAKQKQQYNGCYSVQLQKLIHGFEKKANNNDEIKQKYKKIRQVLNRIKQKKVQNSIKAKEWKELQIENTHMRIHLKKTKQLYLQARQAHNNITLSQL